MSFDIILQTCNLTDKTKEAVDPFTGDTIQIPTGEHVTAAERSALIELLAAAGASEPDKSGIYHPRLSDGSSAEVYFSNLASDPDFGGGIIVLRGLSPEQTRFIFSLADLGNLAIYPGSQGAVAIVTSVANAQRVVSRWPDVVVAQTPEELHVILRKGFDGWKQYRDYIVEPHNADDAC
jgi:hypothetical protein